jgi:hypothetical protein
MLAAAFAFRRGKEGKEGEEEEGSFAFCHTLGTR